MKVKARVFVVSFLVVMVMVAVPLPGRALAAVGDALRTVTPTAAVTVDNQSVDPGNCSAATSLAIVQGSKLAGVDGLRYPVLLAISCLETSGSSTLDKRSRINFIDPGLDPATGLPSGKVIKSIQTKINGVVATPGNGWSHLVSRPDKGDLLACGSDGKIYSIDYSQFTSVADGTATLLPRPSNLPSSCSALAWDGEEDIIYQGSPSPNGKIDIARYRDGTTTLLGATFDTPCTPNGVAITGGVLVAACANSSTVLRLDKSTGALLAVNGTLGVLGLAAGANLNPGLGDLACDPVSFHKNAQGKDLYKDAMWSRNGVNGNGVVALEFPAFTCGLPGNATVLRAGMSAPGPLPGALPRTACFDGSVAVPTVLNPGNVLDSDDDGLPDCWETSGIDFDGDGTTDLQLCVQVDTNGDGIPDATECADPTRKDLFVEVDWMEGRRPPATAMSQTQPVSSVVGIKSVREAFAWAPVDPLPSGAFKGIAIHFQMDEQASFSTLDANSPKKSQVTELLFTPCTPPAFTINADGSTTQNPKLLSDAADFDVIKKDNFGTAAERGHANAVNILNAKRLAFRYALFANKQVGLNGGGAGNSGCAEVGGDDLTVTLGAFSTVTADDVAGTLMHEIGHTLGLRHGSHDNVNCKPNLRSVMSYTRQLAYPLGPIPSRRLDFSRAFDLDLNEATLDEGLGIGSDPSLGPVSQLDPASQLMVSLFATPDRIAYAGTLGAWTVVPATGLSGVDCPIAGGHCVNWNQSKFTSGPNKGKPSYSSPVAANLNVGSGGCPGTGTILEGNEEWGMLQYRASAALEFAGGASHGEPETDITPEQAVAQGLAADLDGNGIADSQDCGTTPGGDPFLCAHRVDVKPSFPLQCDPTGCYKVISQSLDSTVTVVIFSERDASSGALWIGPDLVNVRASDGDLPDLNGIDVKVNNSGSGTCSASDVAYPGEKKDGIKDLKCQFLTSALAPGPQVAVVTWVFRDQSTGELRKGMATQLIKVVP